MQLQFWSNLSSDSRHKTPKEFCFQMKGVVTGHNYPCYRIISISVKGNHADHAYQLCMSNILIVCNNNTSNRQTSTKLVFTSKTARHFKLVFKLSQYSSYFALIDANSFLRDFQSLFWNKCLSFYIAPTIPRTSKV